MERIRNIGIFAHVDAGKTTLSEQLLRHCGAIREVGSVDRGTAHTDRMDIERRRGISIRSTCAPAVWQGVRLNLIDTPGHSDFASEVERSLWALDGAVLVIDAAEGVKPQTGILMDAFQRGNMPALLFLNKMDRDGVRLPTALSEVRRQLTGRAFDPEDAEQMLSVLAEEDEEALEAYIAGDAFPAAECTQRLRAMVGRAAAFPVLHGSALRDQGIEPLLDAIIGWLPPPAGDPQAPPSGIVFALDQDRTLGRAAYVRLYQGTVQNRDGVALSSGQPAEAKVTQVRAVALDGRGEDLGVLRAGEIGMLYGLGDVRVGQVIGSPDGLPDRIRQGAINTPLLMTSVVPDDPAQRTQLRQALDQLAAEDPLLAVEQLGGAQHLRVMGGVQLEVIGETLATRFGLRVGFGEPHIIHRETIRRPATGFFAYTMPKPCWAVIEFALEPLPRGSGIEYASIVPAKDIMPRYQHQIEQALPLALSQGMLGWQVDDVRITLTGGEHHLVHTHPLDFILATPVALMDGLRRAGTVLLEPILSVEMTIPEACYGRIASELAQMRGSVEAAALEGERMRVTARVPMATSTDLSVRLAALTGGRGAMAVRLSGYADTDETPPPTCPRKGVHPLDTAKYILAARNAMGGGVFES